MTSVRIGMVGCGGMGSAHLRRLGEIPEAHVVALCDVVDERARQEADPFGARTYTDAGRMIDEAEIDALYVCVPPHTHEDIESRAARRGLHLFVEKPVGLYMEQAIETARVIREARVLSQVGYQLRYLPHTRQLKEFLAGKQIGGAYTVRWCGAPDKDWWRRYDQGGGQLVEMTTHQVDLLRWFLGEVEAVSAAYSFNRLFEGKPDLTVPDTQSAMLLFESGAAAVLSTSCAVGGGGKSELEIVLPNARATWGWSAMEISPADAYPVPELPIVNPSVDEVFVHAVASGDRSLLLSPYDDALKTAAVTIAANRSAEQGGRMVRMREVLG